MNVERKQKHQTILLVLGLLAIIGIFGGLTYAFFNYTRTGVANTIKLGSISFSNNYESISLTNVFPISSNAAATDTTNVASVEVGINGKTSYFGGIEYLVTLTDANVKVGTKTVPVSLIVTTDGIGTSDDNYFANRGGAAKIYKVLAWDELEDEEQILVGYIPNSDRETSGTITIKTYLDSAKIAISDTYDGTESDNMGTTSEWMDNRVYLTTEEWNSLATTPISFKVKIEANEGTWVENIVTINTMNTLPSDVFGNIGGRLSFAQNIKEIYFNRMPAGQMERRYNSNAALYKADLTYNNEGKVLTWVEEDPQDNTKFIMYIASDGDTYLTTGSGLFAGFSGLEKIVFNNINTSNVSVFSSMFVNCEKLTTIVNLDKLNTSNAVLMDGMFQNTGFVNLDLRSFDTSKVTNMNGMFYGNDALVSLDISGLGSNVLTNISYIVEGCTSLENLNMVGFNFGQVTSLANFLGSYSAPNLQTINLSNANMSNITTLAGIFYQSANLMSANFSGANISNATSLSGAFSGSQNLISVDFSNTNMASVSSLEAAFNGCNSVETINFSNVYMPNVTNMMVTFQNCSSLKELDLSFVSKPFTDYNFLFDGDAALERIYVSSGWDVSNPSNNAPLFTGCISLVGQAPNTTYSYTDYNVRDKTYAKIATDDTVGFLTDISLKPTN